MELMNRLSVAMGSINWWSLNTPDIMIVSMFMQRCHLSLLLRDHVGHVCLHKLQQEACYNYRKVQQLIFLSRLSTLLGTVSRQPDLGKIAATLAFSDCRR